MHPAWVLVVVILAGGYLGAVRRLRRRGRRWPAGRSASFAAGALLLAVATMGWCATPRYGGAFRQGPD